MQKFLNIGCGSHFIDDSSWVNIDLNVRDPSVHPIDIFNFVNDRSQLSSFDGVYLSHVLEHLAPQDSFRLLSVCRSLLKAGGSLRIITPNFDSIVHLYLQDIASKEYVLAKIEKLFLLEQCVRSRRSGTLRQDLRLLCEKDGSAEDYVYHRFGDVLGSRISSRQHRSGAPTRNFSLKSLVLWRLRRSKEKFFRLYLDFIYLLTPKIYRGNVLTTEPGERHLWIYSPYEIAEISQSTGYTETRLESAGVSRRFRLDDLRFLELNKDGTVRKGTYSMFIELLC